jgi:hypothetical protein
VPVTCSEACALRATVSRAGTTVGSGSWALGGKGRTYVFVTWRRSARALLRGRRAVRLRLVVEARDAAGNARRATRTLTLR